MEKKGKLKALVLSQIGLTRFKNNVEIKQHLHRFPFQLLYQKVTKNQLLLLKAVEENTHDTPATFSPISQQRRVFWSERNNLKSNN